MKNHLDSNYIQFNSIRSTQIDKIQFNEFDQIELIRANHNQFNQTQFSYVLHKIQIDQIQINSNQ